MSNQILIDSDDIYDMKIYTEKSLINRARVKTNNYNINTVAEALPELDESDLSHITGFTGLHHAVVALGRVKYSKNITGPTELQDYNVVQGSCTDGSSMYYDLAKKGYLNRNDELENENKKTLDNLIIKVHRDYIGNSSKKIWYIVKNDVVQICCDIERIPDDRPDGYTSYYDFNNLCYDYNSSHFGHGNDLTYVSDLKLCDRNEYGVLLILDSAGVWVANPDTLDIINRTKIIFSGQYDYNNSAIRTSNKNPSKYKMSGITYYSNSSGTQKKFVFEYTNRNYSDKAYHLGGIFGIYKLLSNPDIKSNTTVILVQRIMHFKNVDSLTCNFNIPQGISCNSNYIFVSRTYLYQFDEYSYSNFTKPVTKKRNILMFFNWNGSLVKYLLLPDYTDDEYINDDKFQVKQDNLYREIESVFNLQNSTNLFLYTVFLKSDDLCGVTKRITLPRT